MNPYYRESRRHGKSADVARDVRWVIWFRKYHLAMQLVLINATIFIILQKNTFVLISCMGSKVPFLPFFFWNHAWNLKKNTKTFLLKQMKMTIRKSIHNMSQGLSNPGFMQEKYNKGFFWKPLEELNFLLVLGSYEFLEDLQY